MNDKKNGKGREKMRTTEMRAPGKQAAIEESVKQALLRFKVAIARLESVATNHEALLEHYPDQVDYEHTGTLHHYAETIEGMLGE